MTLGLCAVVLTKDGERHLARCLESLSFCDEILVVDSQSTDATREIATAHGARVLVHPWEGPLPQFRFALAEAAMDWVLSLDQDEWLSPELAAEVQALFRQGAPQSLAGFTCPRRSWYFDRYLKHSGWYPDRLLRLFHRQRMEVRASGPHYSFHALGPVGAFSGDIVHHPYAGLQEHLNKLNYYTQEAACSLHEKGRRAGLATALGHGLARFVKIYLLRRGFLDGRAGLILALHGFFYAFHKYIRVTELDLPPTQTRDEAQSFKD